jgi:hypothetical protein
MQTFSKDVKNIKKLIKEENDNELEKLSNLFIIEYILKIQNELNSWERHYWNRIVYK